MEISTPIQDYRKIKKIGEGTFSETYLVEHLETLSIYKMKIQNDQEEGQLEAKQEFGNEIKFYREASHPFILGYIGSFPYSENETSRQCLILEHPSDGCDLKTIMNANQPIPEDHAIMWFTQLCLGLARMHQMDITHNCINQQNILLFGQDPSEGKYSGIAKLGEFESQKSIRYDQYERITLQQYKYFAPEIQKSTQSQKSDIWAIGILFYEMLTGNGHPLEIQDSDNLYKYWFNLPTTKYSQFPSYISAECQSLITKMLQKDPSKRYTILDVLQTPIIYETIYRIIRSDKEKLDPIITKQLKELDIKCAPIEIQNEEAKEEPSITPDQSSENLMKKIQEQIGQSEDEIIFTQERLKILKSGITSFSPNLAALLVQDNWLWTVEQLNAKAIPNKKLKCLLVKGPIQRIYCHPLQNGLFYGQTEGEKKDGLGILYAIDEGNVPWLFQCEWKQDLPIKGRITGFFGTDWYRYDGSIGQLYMPTGDGFARLENGSQYKGGTLNGGSAGYGKYQYPDKTSLKVYWHTVTHKPYGLGKQIYNSKSSSLFRQIHI
ncbi:hypothetical protein FGO68_gene177 [Halteria grandinella]|uniref:Protein kinase domain-containing protein n=1 Tax=Halteria grandinella TaxID=5974 RepID=A0A8J8T3V5_HALGN|nr:hypothetical protein FGO68_gene177 [Halteria grandinella]